MIVPGCKPTIWRWEKRELVSGLRRVHTSTHHYRSALAAEDAHFLRPRWEGARAKRIAVCEETISAQEAGHVLARLRCLGKGFGVHCLKSGKPALLLIDGCGHGKTRTGYMGLARCQAQSIAMSFDVICKEHTSGVVSERRQCNTRTAQHSVQMSHSLVRLSILAILLAAVECASLPLLTPMQPTVVRSPGSR